MKNLPSTHLFIIASRWDLWYYVKRKPVTNPSFGGKSANQWKSVSRLEPMQVWSTTVVTAAYVTVGDPCMYDQQQLWHLHTEQLGTHACMINNSCGICIRNSWGPMHVWSTTVVAPCIRNSWEHSPCPVPRRSSCRRRSAWRPSGSPSPRPSPVKERKDKSKKKYC